MALFRRGVHLDTHGVDNGAAVFGRLAEAARAAPVSAVMPARSAGSVNGPESGE
jgi:hypothetical protein